MAFVLVASVASALALLVSGGSSFSPLLLVAAPLMELLLALMGLLNDRQNLHAIWRYDLQLAAAFAVILASPLVALSLASLSLVGLLLIAVIALINYSISWMGSMAWWQAALLLLLLLSRFSLRPPGPFGLGGCPARFPALELESRQGVHG